MSSERKQAEMIKEISGVNPLKCMKCGKCSATCPSYNEMDIKPQMKILKAWLILSPSGNAFPALHVWRDAPGM